MYWKWLVYYFFCNDIAQYITLDADSFKISSIICFLRSLFPLFLIYFFNFWVLTSISWLICYNQTFIFQLFDFQINELLFSSFEDSGPVNCQKAIHCALNERRHLFEIWILISVEHIFRETSLQREFYSFKIQSLLGSFKVRRQLINGKCFYWSAKAMIPLSYVILTKDLRCKTLSKKKLPKTP